MQFGPGEGPEVYLPFHDPLGSWFAMFMWYHHDLCLFHQAIDREVTRRSEQAGALAARYTAGRDAVGWDDEGANIALARLDQVVRTLDMETQSMRRYADQLFIVGLWAMAEQYLGRTLMLAENPAANGATREAPHKWPVLSRRFAALGIDLRTMKSYEGADECRTLNNKIKHVGAVDAGLAAFANFQGQEGASFERGEATIALQFYSDAVFEFVGCTMETAGDLLGN